MPKKPVHIPCGETTQGEYEFFFNSPTDLFEPAKISLEVDYVTDLDVRDAFFEGVVKRLCELGFECELSEREKIKAEMKRRFKEMTGAAMPKTIKKWLAGETVPSDINRENNYDLCLSLGMNLDETARFFIKNFFMMPFNFKDKIDAVYYYSLRKNLGYFEIKKLLEKAEKISIKNVCALDTVTCGKRLCQAENEHALFDYIENICCEKKRQFTTARKMIKQLALENLSLSEATHRGKVEDAKFTKDLWKAIMGFSAADEGFSISASSLPKRLRYSFFNEQQMGDLLNSNGQARRVPESFEMLRKTLITMKFYNFYKRAESLKNRDNKAIKELIFDFYEQTDLLMNECGFAGLYLRHPFDWLILFCANTPDPLNTFRNQFYEALDKE